MHKPSKFLETIFREEKMKEQQNSERIERLKNLYHKKNSYQEKLRQKHKQQIKVVVPLLKEKSPTQIKSEQRRVKAKSFKAIDIYRLGNQNMKLIHSNISPDVVQKNKSEMAENFYMIRTASSRIEYKDYLKESKLKR